MTTPRLYLFDRNLKSAGGHYLGYASRVTDAAEELGITPVIVASRQMDPSQARTKVLPALELNYWEEMCPAAGEDSHEHLARSAERLAQTLDRIQRDEKWRDDDVLFFPYINLAEVMGLARWKRHAGITPRTVLLFGRDLDEQGTDAALGARTGATLLRQALADLYACPGSERIRLFTDSDNLAEEHSQALRRRFQTVPIPVDPALFAPRPDRANNSITIVYLGDARTEKGYTRLPAIAYALKVELATGRVQMVVQSNFNVPRGEPGIAAARDFLSTVPNVTVLPQPITDQQYNDYLSSADLIVLPYQVDRYISRTSGILAEAICAGVPAVVPQGTWLADQVRRHGAGIIYDGLDPEGPARAVVEALATLDSLRSRAEDRRSAYAHFHRPSRLVEFICGADAMQAAGCLRSQDEIAVRK
jgi:glycosyltransferase involved in cell wall biosynthesis